MKVLLVAALGLVLVVLPGPAADGAGRTIIVPPRADSLSTLNALQTAIDEAEPGTTIQLEAGVYDLSALILLDASAPPSSEYTTDPLTGLVHYNPHRLQPRFHGLGLLIAGNELTIRGALDDAGRPLTELRGNPDPRLFAPGPRPPSASLFTILGNSETPSTAITIQDLVFSMFRFAVNVQSEHEPNMGTGVPASGTLDLLIQNNEFRFMDRAEGGISVAGRHTRPTIRANRFIGSGRAAGRSGPILTHIIATGSSTHGHLVDLLIEDNLFSGGRSAVWLNDRQERSVVRNNSIGGLWGLGILAQAGALGRLPAPSVDGLIDGNRIEGARFGVALWGTEDWRVSHNRVSGTQIGIWTEWNVFEFPVQGVIQLTAAARNVVTDNDVRGNQVGILVGANSRDSDYTRNDVRDSAIAGYQLDGATTVTGLISSVTFPGASGNLVQVQNPRDVDVIDRSGCRPGPGNCPQLDSDADGRVNEDPVDSLNNDGDRLEGLSLVDEDPVEVPNVITGAAARIGTQMPDMDGDGLPDTLELKLGELGWCVTPEDWDTDGDGTSDFAEIRARTAREGC